MCKVNNTAREWPKHADGMPKKMGEMTPEERRAQFEDAVSVAKGKVEGSGTVFDKANERGTK